MQPDSDRDPLVRIIERFIDADVEFVLIGGMAARLHGTGHATIDVDVCPNPVDDNLERLSALLVDLNARLRVEGDPAGVPFDPHPALLRNMSALTLITDLGPLDLCSRPAGFPGGYADLAGGIVHIVVDGYDVPVASLRDVVTSKRVAGRPKDIVALPSLERHLRQE